MVAYAHFPGRTGRYCHVPAHGIFLYACESPWVFFFSQVNRLPIASLSCSVEYHLIPYIPSLMFHNFQHFEVFMLTAYLDED